MKAELIEQAAQEIADVLFANNFGGGEVSRLAQETDKQFDAPGWCKSAVAEQARQVLERLVPKCAEKARAEQ